MINLKEIPKESGVYQFIVDNEIIYVGSSKNLYKRMSVYNTAIKQGSNQGHQTDLYQFLQSNQFTIQFQLEENYKQLEQQLIEKYNPKYNANRAYTGCGAEKGREAEYHKKYYQEYKEEYEQHQKEYYESHKKDKQRYYEEYNHQLCLYNGKTLTLCALQTRFRRKGIEHSSIEAKKYLIK